MRKFHSAIILLAMVQLLRAGDTKGSQSKCAAQVAPGVSQSSRPMDECPTTIADHFRRFTGSVLSWGTILGPPASAAASQLLQSHTGFADDWSGFAKHTYVNALGTVSGKFFDRFALPAAFHQDEEYVPLGPGKPMLKRWENVALHLVRARTDDHRGTVFNASAIPGFVLTTALSNVYQPVPQRNLDANLSRLGSNALGFSLADICTEFEPDILKFRLLKWLRLKSLPC